MPAAGTLAASSLGVAQQPTPAASLPTFAQLTKDARWIQGPIGVWQKEDKVWFELGPAHWGKPYLLSPKIRSGIGQGDVLGGLMALSAARVVEFQRVFNQVRLVARNQMARAIPGSPEALALSVALSPSLLSSSPVASQPHPERQTVLVEANALFLADLLAMGPYLQRTFRQSYNLDGRHTSITGVRTSPQAVMVETQHHFYTATLAVSQPGSAVVPTLPSYLPDARSLFVALHFSLAPLPSKPMNARKADPRLGHFTQMVMDFSDDLQRSPRQRYVNRWRLEKKDPGAELSEPVQAITYWIDRNVPLKYRDVVREGVLEWNKAFERIGFKNAIVVQQQADDASFDTLDYGVASVRWMLNPEPRFGAIGPSHVDPRTGEILDSDIAIEGLNIRANRSFVTELVLPNLSPHGRHETHDHDQCLYAPMSAEQLSYALDLLDALGEVDPDGPQAEQFVRDHLKSLTMHEVGHSLGLRHNFRASRLYAESQLADPKFTREVGISGSVMDYNAINLNGPVGRDAALFQTTLGPYDYWAIEYAYRPLPAADEPTSLLNIAARSSEPSLAYATDEDFWLGLDPEVAQGDLGQDPLAFSAKRLTLARALFKRQETRVLRPDRDYAALRRSLNYALNDVGRVVGLLTRQMGGVRTLRDFPGSGRDPLSPVGADTTAKALSLIIDAVLVPDGLSVSPALQRRLAPDFMDRSEIRSITTDFSVAQRLAELQRSTLAQLMSDAMASRLMDAAAKQEAGQPRFTFSDLFQQVDRAVWAELAGPSDMGLDRQSLQRDYINRVSELLLKPGAMTRVQARSEVRQRAQDLLRRLRSAQSAQALSPSARAHLRDSADSLSLALSAPLQRSGP